MRTSLSLFSLTATILLSGCIFQNIGSETRLRDAVSGYNDEMRWYRVDLAQQRVAPRYRNTFRQHHHAWGKNIQLADMDIVHVETSNGDKQAVSLVKVSWYDQGTMLMSHTILRQNWRKVTGGYILLSENVQSGSKRLLEPPPEKPEEDVSVELLESEELAADAWNEPTATVASH